MWVLTDGSQTEYVQARACAGMDCTPLSVKEMLPKRRRDSHKGDYGKAAIVAGGEA